jgi:hypothetical protein
MAEEEIDIVVRAGDARLILAADKCESLGLCCPWDMSNKILTFSGRKTKLMSLSKGKLRDYHKLTEFERCDDDLFAE